MTKSSDNSGDSSDKPGWAGKAIAGAAIGSAALAAALLYSSRRKGPKKPAAAPDKAPETD